MKKHLNQLREQLGVPGITGVVLLALASAFLTLTINPLERETVFMHSRLDAVNSKSASKNRSYNLGNRQKELAQFFASLPNEKDVTDVLASIYASASATGVVFKQAEYKPEAQDNSHMSYGLTFPVQGEYVRIRLFVANILANNPAIALDHISFQRERINDTNVKAEIRFTLFLRPTSGN